MNPVSNAILEINMTIQPQILKEAFGKETYGSYRRVVPVSLDEMIKSKVIRRRVIKDCDLLGGIEVTFSLDGIPQYTFDGATSIYQIPPERIGNRELISILSVNYGSMGVGNFGAGFGGTDVQTTAMRVMDSFSNVPQVSTADVELIGYNTISVTDNVAPSQALMVRGLVAYDENLTTIQPRSYPIFAKACVLAVKSYIYKELSIRLDQGILEQGQNLGMFKQIVDTYENAEADYQEYLRATLQKVLFMNDVKRYGRFNRLQITPGL